MEFTDVSPDEMAKHLVRYKNLVPRTKLESKTNTLPVEVTRPFGAGVNYSYMAPAMEGSFITRFAAITGGDAGDAISMSMAISQPGEGPYLHMHMHTDETFLLLYGTMKVIWGPNGEFSEVLNQYDLINVPKGVLRTFENVGDEPAAFFVVIQGDKDKFNDVSYTPALAADIAAAHGDEIIDQLKTAGRNFTAGVPS